MENSKTVVLFGKNDIRLVDRPVKEPGEGEVIVSIRDCGICGSDTHWVITADGTNTNDLGHEASGIVTKLGKGVTSLNIGDRVALEPGNACNACKNCLRGMQNTCLVEQPYGRLDSGTGYMTKTKVMKASYCHNTEHFKIDNMIGSGALFDWIGEDCLETIVEKEDIAQDYRVKLPANVSDEEGAFMEPLAVAVHDCRRGGVEAGKSVLVLGAGSIGLLCMMTAKAMGATNVCITDIMEDRLTLATELGATATVNTLSRDRDDVIREIHEKMGEEPDIVLECTGVEWCLQLSLLTVVPGGCVCVIGRGAPDVTLPIGIANERQITIQNCWRYDRFCFPIAIDLVAKGKVNVARLVTHRYNMEKAKEAFDAAIQRNPGVLKVMVHCNTD